MAILRYTLYFKYLCKLLENMNFNQRIAAKPPPPPHHLVEEHMALIINWEWAHRSGRECVPFFHYIALLGRMALLLLLCAPAPYNTQTHQSHVLVHSMKSEKKNKYERNVEKYETNEKKDVVFRRKTNEPFVELRHDRTMHITHHAQHIYSSIWTRDALIIMQ